jgi:twinkle protein
MRTHQPCPCGDSSDAYTDYGDHGWCFSCSNKKNPNKRNNDLTNQVEQTVNTPTAYTKQIVPYRNHSVSALKKYDCYQLVAGDGALKYSVYTYPNGAKKRRNLVTKAFDWDVNSPRPVPGLFGMDKFDHGASKYCTITEGEEDTISSYEMLGEKYPVFSVQSASTAVRDCTVDKEKLDKYERIYLCFDEDKPGQEATLAVSSMFPYQKVYIVKKGRRKDSSEYLQNNEAAEYSRIWWSSKRHDPENIVSSLNDIKDLFSQKKKESICRFPFSKLEGMTLGIRTGEVTLFKALEGVGKTEVLGAIEYTLLKETDIPIGVIHLEEDINRSARRMVSYETKKPVHVHQMCPYSDEEVFDIFSKLVKTDGRMNFYKPGKNDDDPEAFLAAIRFMVVSAGCKVVLFDHISRLATQFKSEDTVKLLDYLSTRLASMAAELDFQLIMISHVNDEGETRGSRNIGKEAWTVIALHRDIKNPDPTVRNRTDMVIEKNRYASYSGPAGSIYFNPETFCLQEDQPEFREEVPQ